MAEMRDAGGACLLPGTRPPVLSSRATDGLRRGQSLRSEPGHRRHRPQPWPAHLLIFNVGRLQPLTGAGMLLLFAKLTRRAPKPGGLEDVLPAVAAIAGVAGVKR